MKFLCSGCGACCILAGRLGLMPANEETGACIHLTKGQQCAIYDTRPDVCRVDVMAQDAAQRNKAIDRIEYYKRATVICNEMIDALALDVSLKIDPTEYDKKIE